MIGRTIRNYRIVSELGKGGMGVVYLAEHINLPRRFVVKSLAPALTQDPEFLERFYQEAQNQAMLAHPAIVQATDYFEDSGEFFLVMEFVDGQALDAMISARGSLPESEALSIFRGVLEGLGFAHRKGVIHRDVKPSNILVDQSGRARITDFGIAILAGSQRLTATGLTVGTAWYMSPEQIRRPRSIDQRSDIYSAGIVLYEMLTGSVPFDGDTDFSVKEQQINKAPPDPRAMNPAISSTLAQCVQKAMAKEPDKRFQNCGEFLAGIDAYRAQASDTKVTPAKWGLAAALAALMIAVGAGIYFSKPVRLVVDEEAMLRKDHEAGFILIQGAAEKASLACRELKEIDLKRQNLEIAKGLGDTGLVDAYSTQIEEIAQNIRDYASEYKDLIGRLVGLKKPVAEAEFEHYANELLGKKSFDQIHVSRLVERHYQEHLHGASPEHAGLTHETCTEK
ncbi:MAG: serine/threonine protein kinase [Gammaproteobacteria bacterium]